MRNKVKAVGSGIKNTREPSLFWGALRWGLEGGPVGAYCMQALYTLI